MIIIFDILTSMPEDLEAMDPESIAKKYEKQLLLTINIYDFDYTHPNKNLN